MGTVGYMSPEQLRGKPVDQRTDIFSFGTVLYEMLSGQKAFQKEATADTISAILREDPPELSGTNKNVDQGLDALFIAVWKRTASNGSIRQAISPLHLSLCPAVKAGLILR